VTAVAERPPRPRQRLLYDDLWRSPREAALSPDLIRLRVWRPYLRSPIADIGAGDALLSRVAPDHHVVSVDLSPAGLVRARGPAAVCAAEAVPLRNRTMGTVVASELLEHVEQPVTVLRECHRILAPEGLLLLSAPLWPISRAAYLYFWGVIRKRPTLGNLSEWDPQHERRYRLPELVRDVVSAKFAVERVVPLFGSASTLMLYVVEPLVGRLSGRPVRLADRLAAVDRVLRPCDHASAVALVCRPL
jgi:SAM-dependent methyltransferase